MCRRPLLGRFSMVQEGVGSTGTGCHGRLYACMIMLWIIAFPTLTGMLAAIKGVLTLVAFLLGHTVALPGWCCAAHCRGHH
jgi:hypothetical protein